MLKLKKIKIKILSKYKFAIIKVIIKIFIIFANYLFFNNYYFYLFFIIIY